MFDRISLVLFNLLVVSYQSNYRLAMATGVDSGQVLAIWRLELYRFPVKWRLPNWN